MVIGLAASLPAGAVEISARQLQQGNYQVVLTNPSKLDEREAQSYVAQVAASICKGLSPVLGKYHFDAQEALGTGDPSREPASFRFVQEVSCAPATKAAAPVTPAKPLSQEETLRISDEVTKLSEEYFHLLATRQFDAAFSRVRGAAVGTDRAAWVRDQQTFQSLAGDSVSLSIMKISVYDNPPAAPEPGVYVAADFRNAYRNVPYQCGYLMWHRPNGGSFGITRSEVGHVTAEQLKAIPEGQRPELLKKLRCELP
jgi:hypothetical protein